MLTLIVITKRITKYSMSKSSFDHQSFFQTNLQFGSTVPQDLKNPVFKLPIKREKTNVRFMIIVSA